MNYEEALKKFKASYTFGNKIYFFITGGAISLTDILKVPGGGDIIDGIYIPYSDILLRQLVQQYCGGGTWEFNSCSELGALLYYHVAKNMIPNSEAKFITVASMALTTRRYRKGENVAYISLADKKMWKVALNKIAENKHSLLTDDEIAAVRLKEDRKISQIILSLVVKDDSMMPEMETGETLVRLGKDV